MENAIKNLGDHVIICGFGRMGRLIAEECIKKGRKYVVVEQNSEYCDIAIKMNHLCIRGSATEDETLEKANIRTASSLVSVVHADADNVYITLTARGIRPDRAFKIIARAADDAAVSKLRRAGADRIVSPYSVGARRIAWSILDPHLADFFDFILTDNEFGVKLQEVHVSVNSPAIGKSLSELARDIKTNVLVIGRKKMDGTQEFNPSGQMSICGGDILFVLGNGTQCSHFVTALKAN
ncbi:MAG: TrkA family potassium uptake protein [Planctomycetes bacterium]|nr:TrkA family potassium uptake protein [Planctomycetota bacterium]